MRQTLDSKDWVNRGSTGRADVKELENEFQTKLYLPGGGGRRRNVPKVRLNMSRGAAGQSETAGHGKV